MKVFFVFSLFLTLLLDCCGVCAFFKEEESKLASYLNYASDSAPNQEIGPALLFVRQRTAQISSSWHICSFNVFFFFFHYKISALESQINAIFFFWFSKFSRENHASLSLSQSSHYARVFLLS